MLGRAKNNSSSNVTQRRRAQHADIDSHDSSREGNVGPAQQREAETDRQPDQDADKRQCYRHYGTLKDGRDVAAGHDRTVPLTGPSEFRLKRNWQVREGLPKPFLLQLSEPAARLLLGDELIEERQQFRTALGNGPGRE